MQHQIQMLLELSFRDPRASGHLEILMLALNLQSLGTAWWPVHPVNGASRDGITREAVSSRQPAPSEGEAGSA